MKRQRTDTFVSHHHQQHHHNSITNPATDEHLFFKSFKRTIYNMIPTNIRRADELKWKEQVLRQSACKCQHQPQSQQSTPPPPAYSSTTPTRQSKKFYGTSDPLESKFGHCKAVRKGPFVYVSALKGSDPKTGKVAYPGDVASQTRQALREGVKAVNALGGKGAEDVMRVRMYIKVSFPLRVDFEGQVIDNYRRVPSSLMKLAVPSGVNSEKMVIKWVVLWPWSSRRTDSLIPRHWWR